MDDVREDVLIYPLLTELLGCLCDEMADSGLPVTCSCTIVPGSGPTLDFCGGDSCNGSCPGEAWIRLVGAFPAADFPSADSVARCATPLAFDVEVGVARCLPLGDSRGNPPAPEVMLETARLQMADMAAMRRAIACCFKSNPDVDYVLGRFDPVNGAGGCLISTWNLAIRQL